MVYSILLNVCVTHLSPDTIRKMREAGAPDSEIIERLLVDAEIHREKGEYQLGIDGYNQVFDFKTTAEQRARAHLGKGWTYFDWGTKGKGKNIVLNLVLQAKSEFEAGRGVFPAEADKGLQEVNKALAGHKYYQAVTKVQDAASALLKELNNEEIKRKIVDLEEAIKILTDLGRMNDYWGGIAKIVKGEVLVKAYGSEKWVEAQGLYQDVIRANFQRYKGPDDRHGKPDSESTSYLHAKAMVNQGEILFWKDAYDQAKGNFENSLKTYGIKAEEDYRRALGIYGLDEIQKCKEALRVVEGDKTKISRKQYPEDLVNAIRDLSPVLTAYFELGRINFKDGKNSEAKGYFEKALNLIPIMDISDLRPEEQPYVGVNQQITKATVYLELAEVLGYGLNEYDAAINNYKKALDLILLIDLQPLPESARLPFEVRLETLKMRIQASLAESYAYGREDLKNAKSNWEAVLQSFSNLKKKIITPQDVFQAHFQAMKAHNGLGDLLRIYKIKKADKSRVEELLDQVKQHYLKAIILGKEIEDRTDLSDKDKALIYPQLLKAHRGLQEVYFGLKEYKEAIEEYKEVEKLKGKLRTPRAEKLENNITLLEAHYLGGMTYLYGLKDYENALKAYEAGIKLSSEVVKDLEILPAGRQTEIKELILKLYFGKAETLIQLGSRTNDFQYYDQAIKMLEGILANATFKEMTDQIAIAVGKYTHWQKDWPGKKAALEKAKALLQPVGNKLKDKPEKLYTYLEATLYLGWADLGLGNRESALQLADEGLRLLDPRRKDPDYEELYKKFLELRGAASGVAGIRTAVGLGIESFEDNVGNGERKFKLQGTLLVGGGSLSFAYIDRSRAQDGRILGPWAKDIQLGFNWAGGKIQTTFIKYFLPDGQKVARNLASLEFNRDWQIAKYSYLRFNTFGNFEFNFMDDNPAASYEGQVSYKPTFGRLWSSLTYGYKTDSRARWAPTSPVNLNTHSLNIASGMSGNWGDLGLSFWYPLTYQLQQNSSEVTIENDSNGNRWVVYPSGYKEFFPRHLAPSISLGGTINFGSFSVNASVSKAFSKDYQSSYFNLEIGKNW